jgi:putative hydrolase of the HAD superfamily
MVRSTVLFDLGGTLAYYYEMSEFPGLLRESINKVRDYILGEGMPVPSFDEVERGTREEDHEATDYRIRPLEDRLYRIFQLDISLRSERLTLEMSRHFMKPIFARGYCYDDTTPVLSELRSRGYKIGVVSNTSWGSPALLWREELNRLGLAQRVNAAVFCRDVGWRKPARQIFEFALEKLDARPQDCLFVGDNPKWDLLGPESVGMTGILINRTHITQDAPVAAMKNLRELLDRV